MKHKIIGTCILAFSFGISIATSLLSIHYDRGHIFLQIAVTLFLGIITTFYLKKLLSQVS
jgi:hypothetical protein